MSAYALTFLLLLGAARNDVVHPERVTLDTFVEVEQNSVYLFNDSTAYSAFDLSQCFNAVALKSRQLKRLRHASENKKPVRLSAILHKGYIKPVNWNFNMVGHYTFHRLAINPMCDGRDLYEIVSVDMISEQQQRGGRSGR
jgi:hypothetical protein